MKKTSKFSRLFSFLWMRKERHCPIWDKALNELISKGNITKLCDYTITFDDKYTVWIENHTFCSGHLYMHPTLPQLQCSRQTAIRLEDFVNGYLDSIKTKILNGELSDKHTEK